MQKCTRPIGMLDGKYVRCGNPAKYTIGSWQVCEECRPIADYYKKKYKYGDAYDEENERGY